MLDWTGERFVPWANEPAVAYEHLHRYIWAAEFVQDKKVLDLASGEGYGAELLARTASSVVGVDIDDEAVRHASRRYPRSNLRFLEGSFAKVPISEAQSFDLITCFEAIEHTAEQDELLQEVKRLLKPDGLFIVSTPNKDVYQSSQSANPFHVKELAFQEFDALITRYFAKVQYLGQRVHPGSSMWPIGQNGNSIREFMVERKQENYEPIGNESRTPIYFIAVASDGRGVHPEGSVLTDCSDELVIQKDQLSAKLNKDVEELVGMVAVRDAQLESLSAEIGKLELQNRGLAAELEKIRRSWVLRVLRKIGFGR